MNDFEFMIDLHMSAKKNNDAGGVGENENRPQWFSSTFLDIFKRAYVIFSTNSSLISQILPVSIKHPIKQITKIYTFYIILSAYIRDFPIT